MVDFEVPYDNRSLPSEATPHLTINHDVASDLDSSNAFEGPEKLLEVWFAPSPTALPAGVQPEGLKSVSADTWVTMLDLVNCKILSVLKSPTVDAYLLSESSMFVFPHKLILKTCGTTTLLLGLHRLLRIAAVEAGFPFHNAMSTEDEQAAATPYRVFYSRKNFLFPDKQHGPHRSWAQEVRFLDDMFEGGSAYMVGKMNGDHWYLYITSPNNMLTPPRTPDEERGKDFPTTKKIKIPTGISSPFRDMNDEHCQDETLEILMTNIDPEHARQFYLSHASAVANDKGLFSRALGDSESHGGSAGASADKLPNGAANRELETSVKLDGGYDGTEGASGSGSGPEIHATEMPSPEHTDCAATEGHALGTVVSDACGLSDLYPKSKYPGARIDAYLFTPCGFSANGIIPSVRSALPSTPDSGTELASSAHYFTVHVTPEPNCSYASFETNVPGGQNGRETADVIQHVVNIFRPGRFSVTLFEAKEKCARPLDPLKDDSHLAGPQPARRRLERIPGYRRIDRIVHDFDDYDLVFRYYEREGWADERAVRVGEDM